MKITAKTMKKILLVLVVLAAIATLTYIFIVRPMMVRQEKAKFEAAVVELEMISTQIEEKIGKPDDRHTEKSCGYSSAKFNKGRRSCGITIELTYKDKPREDANMLVGAAKNLFDAKIDNLSPLDNAEEFIEKDTEVEQILSQAVTLKDFDKGRCFIWYAYLDKHTQIKDDLNIRLHCTKSATSEHYPLID